MTPLKFHYDSGHGWLEVGLREVEQAGLTLADFSSYSYRQVHCDKYLTRYFLEEDCDAPKFLKAFGEAGHKYKVLEVGTDGDSFIRHLCPLHLDGE